MSVLFSIVLSICFCASALDFLRVFQVSCYRCKEYIAHIRCFDCIISVFGAALGLSLTILFSKIIYNYHGLVGIISSTVFTLILIFLRKHTPRFRFTRRILRLSGVLFLLNFLITLCVFVLSRRNLCGYEWLSMLFLLQIFLVPIAGWIVSPIEKRISRRYILRAKKRLSEVKPFVIAITGSYGKTSVKNFLSTILSEKFRVCASPQNYNTPMGLCLTVNNCLKNDDEILIVEMGARYKGDITELCDIVQPDLAIISGIGNQHLSTFGSKLALMDTKYELVQALPHGAPAFFAEDEGSFSLYKRGYAPSYCARVCGSKYSVSITDICMNASGSHFFIRSNDVVARGYTKLIGAHNIANTKLCAMVSLYMGLTLNEIVRGIAKIEAIPHRLQLLPARGNMQIIDDSYNASKEGICAAMHTLELFSGVRIVITPGVIEGGKDSYVTNYACGMSIGKVADYLYAYGENFEPLRDGAICAGMGKDRIICVKSRDKAVEKISGVTTAKVTLIFCNDLPN